ncbi:MAG: hypothetical protein CMI60_01655 [Parvibaculum sp.]|nr:hypothetical protein [Parvibaculum sp.]
MQPGSINDYGMRISEASSSIFAPSRNIITEMIMVQFIAVIMACVGILIFKGDEMSSGDVSVFVVGIFGSMVFLTTLYSRISR